MPNVTKLYCLSDLVDETNPDLRESFSGQQSILKLTLKWKIAQENEHQSVRGLRLLV